MTKKVYRTAQGKLVDLGALQLQNEHVRAVGNMNVNARGDVIDGNNRPIDTRNQRVGRQYNKQTSNVTDAPVSTQAMPNRITKKTKSARSTADIPKPPEDFDDDFDAAKVTDSGGLKAAINRMRQVEQDVISPQDIETINKGS